MTVTSFFKKGFCNDPSQKELKRLHMGCCASDLVDLFTVAAVSNPKGIDYHTEFAKQMIHARSMERDHMPVRPVDMKALMIFASLGMFNLVEDSIKQSLGSPRIHEGEPGTLRMRVKHFVLKDTSAALKLALAEVLSDHENLKAIEMLSARSEEKLAESIWRFLEEKYDAPSSEDLGRAITERWVAMGIDPTQGNMNRPHLEIPAFA